MCVCVYKIGCNEVEHRSCTLVENTHVSGHFASDFATAILQGAGSKWNRNVIKMPQLWGPWIVYAHTQISIWQENFSVPPQSPNFLHFTFLILSVAHDSHVTCALSCAARLPDLQDTLGVVFHLGYKAGVK